MTICEYDVTRHDNGYGWRYGAEGASKHFRIPGLAMGRDFPYMCCELLRLALVEALVKVVFGRARRSSPRRQHVMMMHESLEETDFVACTLYSSSGFCTVLIRFPLKMTSKLQSHCFAYKLNSADAEISHHQLAGWMETCLRVQYERRMQRRFGDFHTSHSHHG